MRRAVLALFLASALGCVAGGPGPSHQLVGRLWNVDAERFAREAELHDFLQAHDFVLLGEVHDNPEHHRLQARAIDRLAAAGRRPAVVFEMIGRDEADALQRALDEPGATAEDVRRAVDWDASGWPAWEIYAPIFETALARGLTLAAGDLARADRATLTREGPSGLPPSRVASLGLDAPLPADARRTLEELIREGHCDLLPEAMIPGMVGFQRARDAQLARSLLDAAGADGAVLVAGAGHARSDVGVPLHLRRLAPDARVASVGLVEVEAGRVDPQSDLAERFGGPAPFDYVWFTRRTPREDPCEELRREFGASIDLAPLIPSRASPGTPAPRRSGPTRSRSARSSAPS